MRPGTVAIVALLALGSGSARSEDRMVITFKDGRVQSIDTATIARIEFAPSARPAPPSTPVPTPAPGTWTGHFAGTDTSGYAMDINLVERNDRVEGGYAYFHKGEGKHVTAVISQTVINGDVLRGTWRQTTGILASGTFEWRWLPGERGRAFEGSFNGTKFWVRMTRAPK